MHSLTELKSIICIKLIFLPENISEMVTIQKIVSRIRTADIKGAGTDGEVYIGFCGREFDVDTSYEDFERGVECSYSAGTSAAAGKANLHDPTMIRGPFLR
jgi:hypothetical protein